MNAQDRFDYAAEVETRGQVSDYRVDLRRADGSVYHASLSGRLVEHGGETYVVSAISDISEILGKEELLRHVVDSCPTPLMMTKLESGEVLFSSPEARGLFGDPETSKVLYVEPGGAGALRTGAAREGRGPRVHGPAAQAER